MTILLILIAIWLVLGISGSLVVFVYDQCRVFGRLTVGDVASAIFATLLGPLVFLMALSSLRVWEYVIYKRKENDR
jgi:hypothetical protein